MEPYIPHINEIRIGLPIVHIQEEGFCRLEAVDVFRILQEYEECPDSIKNYRVEPLAISNVWDLGYRYSHSFLSHDGPVYNLHTNDKGIEIFVRPIDSYIEIWFIGKLGYVSSQLNYSIEEGRHILYRGYCYNPKTLEEIIDLVVWRMVQKEVLPT